MKKILHRLRINTFSKKALLTSLFLITAVSGVGLLFLFNPWNSNTQAAWFNDSWGYRKAITVTVTSSASDISNLDTLITIDTTGMTANLQTNCEDLRFTDVNGSILPYFIDSCTDNSSSNTVWVRINTVPKNTTTYTLYMYYGNATASSGSNSSLFSLYNGLEAYWAMNESSWNTTAGEIKDNSVNASHGTARGDATTTASGQFGRGALFDGGGDSFTTADNAEAELGSSDFTISTWVYMTAYPSTGFGAAIITKDDGAAAFAPYALVMRSTDNNIHSWMSTNGSSWDVMNDTNLGGSSALTLNTWHQVAFVRESGSCKLYIDTVVTSETSSGISCSGTLVNTAAKPYFGGQFQSPNGNGIAGRMDDARIYKRALSASDLSSLYTNPGNIATNVNATIVPSTSFGSEERGTTPVAYWKFDEGQGTVAADSSANSYAGTLSGDTLPAWQTEDQCISSKCLYFNGQISDDTYISVDNPERMRKNGNLTVSAWIKPTKVTGGRIISHARTTSDGWGLGLYNGDIVFTTYGVTDYISSGLTLEKNKWYFVSAVMSSNSVTFYVDGKPLNTVSGSAWTANTDDDLYIGSTTSSGVSTIEDPYNGFIDEIKVYDFARTAAQIQADFNAKGNPDGVSSVLGTSAQNNDALSDGLVGYWKMDEASWNGTSSEIKDASGNGNHGTASGSTTGTGKFGKAGSFDGSNDYADFGNPNSLQITSDITMSAWVNPSSISGSKYRPIFGKRDSDAIHGYELYLPNDNTGYISYYTNGTEFKSSYALPLNQWTHVTATITNGALTIYANGVAVYTNTGATPTYANGNFYIGLGEISESTDVFSGLIDEARIYNRAFTSAEVSQLYNFAPGPVGYWKMEEQSNGSSAVTRSDSSGYGNNLTDTTGSGYVSSGNGKYGEAANTGSTATLNITNASQNSLAITGPITVSAWVKETSAAACCGSTIAGKGVSSSPNLGYRLLINNQGLGTTHSARFTISSAGTSADIDTGYCSFSYGQNVWHYITGVYNGSQVMIYDNGRLCGSTSFTGTIYNNTGDFVVGRAGVNMLIDEVKVYNYARNQSQIVEDMNAGHPAPGSPVGSALGHWKLDEGYGTTANNSGNGGSTLNGTFGGITQSTLSGWTNAGKFGKAVNFDGTTASTDDRINIGSDASVDDLTGSGKSMTVSGWIKPSTIGENSLGVIMAKNGNSSTPSNGWLFELAASSTIKFMVDYSTTDLNVVAANNSITLGAWNHVAVTYDGSGLAANVHIYVNGKEVAYQTQTNSSGTIASDAANNLLIGNNNATGTSNTFDGTIDEVKLYTSALTSAQIALDMNKSQAQFLGATGDKTGTGYESKTAENQKYCIPGDSSTCTTPVGEWNLDEGTGTTANDSSGNANTGTITAGTGGYVNGKSTGKAYNFDSANTVINAGSGTSLDDMTGMTLEAWIYPRSVGEGSNAFILNKNLGNSQSAGWIWHYTSNQGMLFVVDGSTDLVRQTANSVVPLNQWSHVTLTWGGNMASAATVLMYVNGREVSSYQTTTNGASRVADAARSLYIGNASSSDRTFDGYIDNVKVFNYARTASQIVYDYNQGKPVAHWKMDECQGTTINDSSGSSLTGTLTIGGSGSENTIGTCTTSSTAWGNGVSGKRNYSLGLDGTDDYIDLGTVSSKIGTGDVAYSIAAWVKPAATNRVDSCAFSYGGASAGQVISLCMDGSGNFYSVHYSNDHSFTTDWIAGEWQQAVITYDPTTSTERLYLNGKYMESWTPSNLNIQSSATSYIGRASWNGVYITESLVDDVRLYNYALTETQIKTLFNEGAFRVGPVTGAP